MNVSTRSKYPVTGERVKDVVAGLFRRTAHSSVRLSFVLGLVVLLLSGRNVEGAVPRAGYLFYGQAIDEYGWPCVAADNVRVVFRVDGKECGRGVVADPLAPGVNFIAMIRVDDGQGNGYTPGVSVVGDALEIVLEINGTEVDTVAAGPQVGEAGSAAYIKVRAGSDSDEDGLPDAWEQFLVDYNRHDAVTNIIDITPEGDFDGDGACNRDEYLAGTFPEYAQDYFAMNELQPTADGRYTFSFLSVPGMSYAVESTSSVVDGKWSPCPYALDEASNPQSGPFSGDGGFMTIYVDLQDEADLFYRIVVQ